MTIAFAKLVVDDVEAMAAYYAELCGLQQLQRIQADIAGETIDEIILTGDGAPGIIVLKFVDRAAPPRGEVIVGITTDDISAFFERAVALGATVREPARVHPEAGDMVVGFLEDPEGHLIEVVETP